MRTGRPKATLTVTEDERRQLESLAHRSRTASFVARLGRIVLACAQGWTNKAGAPVACRARDGRHLATTLHRPTSRWVV